MDDEAGNFILDDIDDEFLGIDAYYAIPHFSSLTEKTVMEPFKIEFTSYMNLNYLEEFNKFFKMLLFPDGNSPEHRGYVSIYIEVDPALRESGVTEFKLNAIFSVVDSKENPRFSRSFSMEFSDEFFGKNEGHYRLGIDRFLQRSFLLLNSDNLLLEDKLILQCSLQYASYTPVFIKEKILFEDEIIQDILSKVFVKNVEDGEPTYSLELGHKNNVVWRNLREKSLYFKTLYEMAMQEGKEQLLPLSAKEYRTFVNMLYYFFLGSLKHVQSAEEMSELYILADRDDVQELKQLCSEYFKSKLDINNAAELLALADLHNDGNLKKMCHKIYTG